MEVFTIEPVGHIESTLRAGEEAPKQGHEGAPAAWLVFRPELGDAGADLTVGDELLVLTWLHLADRRTLRVHPRDDPAAPLRGVFSTRSQDRPNPVGIHRATVTDVAGPTRIRVAPMEAFDGTPVVDVKPVLSATER